MVLHLTHDEGGFGVAFNDITKDAAFYTTTSHFVSWLGVFSQKRHGLWLPQDDLQDSSSWSSPPLVHETAPLFLAQLNCLHQTLLPAEDASNAVKPIPLQRKLAHQILKHWEPFKDLQQTFAVSLRAEQLHLRKQQRVVDTAEDSVLCTERGDLESQEEDAPKRTLLYTPMAWRGGDQASSQG